MFNAKTFTAIAAGLSLLIFMCNQTDCMDQTITRTTSNTEAPIIDMTYRSNLPILLASGIRDVRTMEEKQKQLLFQRMGKLLPSECALARISNIANPQIILWFTNYFGKVSKATLAWYKKNVLTELPKATFWLADLKAWRFLSTGKNELKGPLVDRLLAGQQLSPKECPLINETSSDVLDASVNDLPCYKLLSSKTFFEWLLTVKDRSILPDTICKRLRRAERLESSLPVSLSQMGYKPELLNRVLEGENTNLLDVEFSLIYPILQYLEGIYYAVQIAESKKRDLQQGKDVAIVFLLPNKEFTYFAVPGENDCFIAFQEAIQKALTLEDGPIAATATICIEPFAYGNDFYDAPYRLTSGGLYRRKNDFLSALQKPLSLTERSQKVIMKSKIWLFTFGSMALTFILLQYYARGV